MPDSFECKTVDNGSGKVTLFMFGFINASNASYTLKEVNLLLNKCKPKSLIVDLSKIEGIDDFGVSILAGIKKRIIRNKTHFKLSNIRPNIQEILLTHNFEKLTAASPEKAKSLGPFVKLEIL